MGFSMSPYQEGPGSSPGTLKFSQWNGSEEDEDPDSALGQLQRYLSIITFVPAEPTVAFLLLKSGCPTYDFDKWGSKS